MAENITNYKCLACTGPLHFGSGSGKLECDYCGSEFDVAEVERFYQEEDKRKAENEEKRDDEWESISAEWNGEGTRTYSCNSCGAELIYDETTVASSCPYCDNPTLIPAQVSGGLKPDYIIPFKLDKDAAIDKLKAHYKGKLLLPSKFSENNHIEEIKGVYVPFWLYDGVAVGKGRYEGCKESKREHGSYVEVTTKHYDVYREGKVEFEKIPADASSQMPNDVMDSLEPYSYEEMQPFSTAYLPGFMADKYDEDAQVNVDRAMKRAKQTTIDELRADVTGYSYVTDKNVDVHVEQGKISYAMMPVWVLNTTWKDKKYMFAMNGQTGKMVGNLPIDRMKQVLSFIIAFVVGFILDAFILNISDSGLAMAFGLGIATVFILSISMKNVATADRAGQYVKNGGIKLGRREDNYMYTTTKRVKKNN